MDFRKDNDLEELQQGTVARPECPQVGQEDHVDGGNSPRPGLSEPPPGLAGSGIQVTLVSRSPQDLHVHPDLTEVDGIDVAAELNEAERTSQGTTAPVITTRDGTVLSGFGRWRSALLHGEREIPCLEYALGREESLQFMLRLHKPERGWNAFVRTRLALTLEFHFQGKALENMRAGGRRKGLAELPNVDRIDVRRKIAEIAGVGSRTVGNVKTIIAAAHPRLLNALGTGALTINKALVLCKLPRADQLKALTESTEDRAIDEVIRRTLTPRKSRESGQNISFLLNALQVIESRAPGSVLVRRGASGRTTFSVSTEQLCKTESQLELPLHETRESTQNRAHSDPTTLG